MDPLLSSPRRTTRILAWIRRHLEDLRDTGQLVLRNLYALAAVAIAMGLAAVLISLFGGLAWNSSDPDGLFPLVGSATIVAIVAALRPSWRPIVSAVWAGAVVTIAWAAAAVWDFSTQAAVTESLSWIWCTIFASALWLLVFRPIAAREERRIATIRRDAERDRIVSAVATEVIRRLDERR